MSPNSRPWPTASANCSRGRIPAPWTESRSRCSSQGWARLPPIPSWPTSTTPTCIERCSSCPAESSHPLPRTPRGRPPSLPHHVVGTLVRPHPPPTRLPKPAVRRPLAEPHLTHQFRPHVRHPLDVGAGKPCGEG